MSASTTVGATSVAMQQGMAAARARNPFAASEWFRRELAERPENLAAKAWLGQSLCVIGQLVEGLALLRSAAAGLLERAHGNDMTFSQALEAIAGLQQWGDMEGALAPARRAAALAPEDARAHRTLAITCGQLNLTDEALAEGEASLALDPDPMMQVMQASMESDAGRRAEAWTRLQRVLSGRPGPRVAFRAHKEAARALDGLGRHGEVFAHLDAAAVLAPRAPELTALDPRIVPRAIEANHATYDADLLSRFAGERFEAPAPAFIMGFYRSGTTLAQTVLATHADAFVADEAHLVGDVQRELFRIVPEGAGVADRLRQLDKAGVERLRAHYWDRVRLRYGEAAKRSVFIDKFTMNTLDLGLINTVFPDARLLFMLRDPRDVVLSAMLQLLPPTPATIHLLTWRGAASFYAAVMDWWLTVQPMLTVRTEVVRYEDAVAEFEPTFRRVFDLVGLPWTEVARDFHAQAAGRFIASPSRSQVSQPLYDTAVQRWRPYAERYADVCDVLDPLSDALGYAI